MVLYSRDNCVQCNATKTAFKAKGIEYEERNTSINPDWEEEAKSYGFMAAPVVVAPDGEAWSGFRPDLIQQYVAA